VRATWRRDPNGGAARASTVAAESRYAGLVPLGVTAVGAVVMFLPWFLRLAAQPAVLALDAEFGFLVILYAVWLSYRESSRRGR